MNKFFRQETVERIRDIAKEEGVNENLAVKVAECESGLEIYARNINREGSIDRGLYQWNSHWHPEISDKCAFDLDCSTRAFCKTVKNNHLDWWSATEHCWRSAYKKSLFIRIRDLLRKIVSLYRKLLGKYSARKNQS